MTLHPLPTPDPAVSDGAAGSRPPALPAWDARRLTGPEGLARILLDGQSYLLRITRQGKLILTK